MRYSFGKQEDSICVISCQLRFSTVAEFSFCINMVKIDEIFKKTVQPGLLVIVLNFYVQLIFLKSEKQRSILGY